MSFNDGKIKLDKHINQDNLSNVIKGLSYHIALEFISFLNDEYNGQNEWEYSIEDSKGDIFTLKISLNDWWVDK